MTQRTQKNADEKFLFKAVSEQVIDAFFEVYHELGYGFLEKVCENALANELRMRGLGVVQQQPIDVFYKGERVGKFFADIIVDRKIILELKVARKINSADEAQLLNYLKATDAQVGYILLFGPEPDFKRKIYSNSRKKHHIQKLRSSAPSASSAFKSSEKD